MPVYEVEVTRFAATTDTVTVQADDESVARSVAEAIALDWPFDTNDTQIESIREITADEVVASDDEVVRA